MKYGNCEKFDEFGLTAKQAGIILFRLFLLIAINTVIDYYCWDAKPIYSLLPPYVLILAFNILLFLTFCVLCSPFAHKYDNQSMFLTYAILFARLMSISYHTDDTMMRNGAVQANKHAYGHYGYLIKIYLPGLLFFFAVVQVRKQILQLSTNNKKQKQQSRAQHPSSNKLIFDKLEEIILNIQVFCYFFLATFLKSFIEKGAIYLLFGDQGYQATNIAMVHNFLIFGSTLLYCCFRNMICNVINILVVYSSIFVSHQVYASILGNLKELSVDLIDVNAAKWIFFVGGAWYFFLAIFVRSLINNCPEQTKHRRRLYEYLEQRKLTKEEKLEATIRKVVNEEMTKQFMTTKASE